ncbi:GtrA family protein [Salinigranum salinum]|uniref:GtrA family protein n=1 Tax=Salinigranum salinum TaxID=1364937 RepID=UPI0018646E0B|nr:GtrA family protein [Salinigranum salinum]
MTIDSRVEALFHNARIGQFISVGAVGATLETIIVAALTAVVGFYPLLAKGIGAEVSISTMFVINDNWTFADEGVSGTGAFIKRWGRSHIVRLVGLCVAFGVLYLLTTFIQFSFMILDHEFWPTIANLVGIGAGMMVNYVAESLYTWDVV